MTILQVQQYITHVTKQVDNTSTSATQGNNNPFATFIHEQCRIAAASLHETLRETSVHDTIPTKGEDQFCQTMRQPILQQRDFPITFSILENASLFVLKIGLLNKFERFHL